MNFESLVLNIHLALLYLSSIDGYIMLLPIFGFLQNKKKMRKYKNIYIYNIYSKEIQKK
jgi:hypothetical protein